MDSWERFTGIKIHPPVVTGSYGVHHILEITAKTGLDQKEAVLIFKEIHLIIAEKLGHHRVESSYSYCGK